MRAATLCVTLLACLVAAAPAAALEQTLVASDGAADDYLGWSVAVDGDTAVVGATQNFNGPGLVYVFTRIGDTWTQSARLQGSDTQAGDGFGQHVAIDGDTIVVGAPRHVIGADFRAGAVYTFARNGAPTRTETAKLTVSAPATQNASLGSGVAIDGDVIAAAAPAEGNAPGVGGYGAVYLFDTTGAPDRHEKARLLAADGAAGDGLGEGYSLAIQGDLVVAGTKTKPASGVGVVNRGAAYTFDATTTGNGTSTDKLVASDGTALDQFGFSADIDGETIVIGANRDSFLGRNYVGSAYTFASTGEHEQTGKLVTSDGISDDRVGWDVAVGGAEIAVAADLDDHAASTTSNEGSVYLFERSSPLGERSEKSRITHPLPERSDNFGSAVDMDGTTLIVGTRSDKVGTNDNQGSATIFYSSATTPACSDGFDNDGDGKIDYPEDPGCTSRDDTSEADPPPGTSPPPTPGAGGAPAGAPPADTTPLPPRIVRPRTQPPVAPTKERILKFATVWDCVPTLDGSPCKTWAWVTIGYFEDARGSAKPKRRRIGSTTLTIRNGTKRRVTAKLSKEGFKLLKKRGTLKARVEIGMSRKGARSTSTTVAVTLKAPKR